MWKEQLASLDLNNNLRKSPENTLIQLLSSFPKKYITTTGDSSLIGEVRDLLNGKRRRRRKTENKHVVEKVKVAAIIEVQKITADEMALYDLFERQESPRTKEVKIQVEIISTDEMAMYDMLEPQESIEPHNTLKKLKIQVEVISPEAMALYHILEKESENT